MEHNELWSIFSEEEEELEKYKNKREFWHCILDCGQRLWIETINDEV